mgnify:CR=1 FL=1
MEKITIATKFDEVVKALNGEESFLSTEELVEFIEDRKEKASKRSGSKKPTARQLENEALKDVFVDTLAENGAMSVSKLISTDAVANFGEGNVSSQRATALLTQLVKEDRVVRNKDGKATVFSACY